MPFYITLERTPLSYRRVIRSDCLFLYGPQEEKLWQKYQLMGIQVNSISQRSTRFDPEVGVVSPQHLDRDASISGSSLGDALPGSSAALLASSLRR